MNKRIKHMIKILKELFSEDIIRDIAIRTKFIQRKSKITADMFLALCLFWGEDLCSSSLVQLQSRLKAKEGIEVSPQALDKRFNKQGVDFLKAVFKDLIRKSIKILEQHEATLKNHFKAIKIVDSTIINLPDELKTAYRGSGGSAPEASAKIQLEYEVFTGSFTQCEVFDGVSSDMDYLPQLQKNIKEKELHLKDLGYFKISHLKYIESKEAYYISKLKSTSSIYVKNDNPEIGRNGKVKKSSLYKKIDIEELVRPLAEGETIEIPDIYIGNINKIKTRLIVTKLNEDNKKKREEKFLKDVKKARKKVTDKNNFWNCINIYITNIPVDILSKEKIHDIYSLRWQIEIMFKIWKSLFKIHEVKKVKLERFECFLYGRLISLILSSSVVFTAKRIIYEEEKKEISEIKSFGIVKEYFSRTGEKIFNGELVLIKFLNTIILNIWKYGKKSIKKGKKSPFLIVESVKIPKDQLVSLVI